MGLRGHGGPALLAGCRTTNVMAPLPRLDNNQFQDPVTELLGSVLSGKDCRIQRIR